MSNVKEVLAEICSVLQYLEDRGELGTISRVMTRVRYTEIKEIEKFVVESGKKKFEITAREI
jgi:hypothetical protein